MINHRTLSIHILVSRCYSPLKRSRHPWEKSQIGQVHSEPSYLVGQKETVIKDKCGHVKRTQVKLNEIPWDKFGTIWALKRIMTTLEKTYT